MRTSPIVLALLAGSCAALYTISVKLGSAQVHAALGAMIITGAAFVVNAIALLFLRLGGQEVWLTPPALWLLMLAGIGAAGVDLLSLLAYERGLRLSSSLIIGGSSTALVLLVGFVVFREPVTVVRALAVALIAAGVLLLHTEGA